jgi:hypothetical protein
MYPYNVSIQFTSLKIVIQNINDSLLKKIENKKKHIFASSVQSSYPYLPCVVLI